jgi:hypothetical protein
LPQYETFRLRQPWFIPYQFFFYLASRRARTLLQPSVSRLYPETATRIEAMARAAGVSVNSLYLFHGLEAMLTSFDDTSLSTPLAGCSAVALTSKRSATGASLMHHNFDNVPLAAPMLTLRERREKGKYRSIEFSIAPLGGAVDGMNERGLSIAYNFAWTKKPGAPAPPVSLAISSALDCCATVSEAVRFICSRPRCGGSMLMLADATGDIGRLELTGGRAVFARPRSSGHLSHSNAFKIRRFRRLRVTAKAVFDRCAPKMLRGERVLASTEIRDQRFERLLHGGEQIDADDLTRLMSDHGADGIADANTICMHGSHWATLASLQFHPARRMVRAAFGPTLRDNVSRLPALSLALSSRAIHETRISSAKQSSIGRRTKPRS